MLTRTIKAKYKNGVFEPLEEVDLLEDSELEVNFKFAPSVSEPELSAVEQRKIQQEFIEQTSGLFKGTWGRTAEEIDDYIRSEA